MRRPRKSEAKKLRFGTGMSDLCVAKRMADAKTEKASRPFSWAPVHRSRNLAYI
jgi:hypothetical protein